MASDNTTTGKAPAPPKESLSASVRRRVEQAQLRADEELRRKLLAQRVDIARLGIAAYQNRQMADAVKYYFSYLRILEQVKKCGEGQLHPSYFDKGSEMSELLMVSGIYWDLAKLFDKTKTQDKYKEFTKYLEKYILFSKDMPYQALCTEAVRKYLKLNKAIHRDAFRNTYKLLGGKFKCFVATSLIDVTLPSTHFELRRFRDQVLKTHPWGRSFVAWYYRNGPKIAHRMDKAPEWIRAMIGAALDFIGKLIQTFLKK
jgi:hypothetical protein